MSLVGRVRAWKQLFHEFVADVREEEKAKYTILHERWLHNEIIDTMRRWRGWTWMPLNPRL